MFLHRTGMYKMAFIVLLTTNTTIFNTTTVVQMIKITLSLHFLKAVSFSSHILTLRFTFGLIY
jgi:hypothetical protein